MVIVNFVGAPCSGKSTLACNLFTELKKRHLNTEYLHEYVKTLIWENNIDDINNQYYIAKKQYTMLKNVNASTDYTVTDSPLILGLLYNEYNKHNVSDISKTKEFILGHLREFASESLYIFVKRNRNFAYKTQGRIHNETESDLIENLLEIMLRNLGINYMTITTDDPIDTVLEYAQII